MKKSRRKPRRRRPNPAPINHLHLPVSSTRHERLRMPAALPRKIDRLLIAWVLLLLLALAAYTLIP